MTDDQARKRLKRATVYQRRATYFVHASSETTDGVWIVWEPILAVSEDEGAEELGRKILAALDGSRSGVPHPRDWKAVLSPLLAIAGVKSWASFAKSAACIEVGEEENRVIIVPTRNLGAKEGFEADPTKSLLTTRDDLARLGEVAAEALRAAK